MRYRPCTPTPGSRRRELLGGAESARPNRRGTTLSVEIRPVTADEMAEFGRVPSYVFADSRTPEERAETPGRAAARVDARGLCRWTHRHDLRRLSVPGAPQRRAGSDGRRHRGRHLPRVPPSGSVAAGHDAGDLGRARPRSVDRDPVGLVRRHLPAVRLRARHDVAHADAPASQRRLQRRRARVRRRGARDGEGRGAAAPGGHLPRVPTPAEPDDRSRATALGRAPERQEAALRRLSRRLRRSDGIPDVHDP